MTSSVGFGVDAGLDPGIARELAACCPWTVMTPRGLIDVARAAAP
jgi:hypothetical protein